MLEPGAPVPRAARVWTEPRTDAVPLADALGDGLILLCFYLWDWSPT